MKSIFYIFLLMPILLWSQSNFEKAEKLFEDGKYESAKPYFENYLKENPNHTETIEYLGDIWGQSKSWDNAIFYYKKLKKIKPSEANYHYKYGGALGMKAKDSNRFVALGMIGEVRTSFEKAIILNPKHIEARWALIEMYIHLPVIVGGSETKATNYANELAKLSPVDGFLSKGHIAEHFKRFPEAEKQYKKAVEIGHSKKSYQKLANLYKNKMNMPEKAKSVLEDFAKQKG